MEEVEVDFEILIKKARNIKTGVSLKNRNSFFSTPELTFVYSDFLNWIEKNFSFQKEKSDEKILKLIEKKKIIPKSTKINSSTLFSFANKIQVVVGNFCVQFSQVLKVGGGLGGTRVTKELYKSQLYDITLISEKDFIDFLPNLPKLFGNKEEAIKLVRKSYNDVIQDLYLN